MALRLALALLAVLLLAPAAHATQGLVPSEPISGVTTSFVDAAMDGDGNITAVWLASDGLNVRAQYARRPAGGPWGSPTFISPPGVNVTLARTVANSQGFTAIAWTGGDGLWVSLAWPGETFGSPGLATSAASAHDIGIDPDGNVTLAWVETGVNGTISTIVYTNAESFGTVQLIDTCTSCQIPQFRLAVAANQAASLVYLTTLGDVFAATRPAASFTMGSPGTALQGVGRTALALDNGIDAAGNSTAILATTAGPADYDIQLPTAPAGSAFSSGATHGFTSAVSAPRIAVGDDGRALAIWHNDASTEIEADYRPPAGAFGGIEVAVPAGSAEQALARFGTNGNAFLVWKDNDGTDDLIMSAQRLAVSSYGPLEVHRGPGSASPAGDFDDAGNGVVVFQADTGGGNRIHARGWDAVAPQIVSATTTVSGTAGAPVPFFGSATDVWGPLDYAWDFGDGGTANGSFVDHTFASGGLFPVTLTVTDGVGNNDVASGSASIAPPVAPPPAPAPPPPPVAPPPAPPSRVPPPEAGESANADEVSGSVLVKLPGTDKFVPLDELTSIPIGSTINATRGVVRISVAESRISTGVHTGNFSRGVFVIRQNAAGPRPVTQLVMQGGSPRVCGTTKRASAAARRRPKVIRRLYGNARGRFQTKGKYSAATVRGTKWLVSERCDGTFTQVQQGSVMVRDFVKRKNIVVKARKSYLAKPRVRRR